MAYGVYRTVTHKASTNGNETTYVIDLLKDGYTGSAVEMDGTGSIFELSYDQINSKELFNASIQNSELSLTLNITNATDLGVLEDIFAADEKEYKLRLKINGSVQWTGFVLVDLLEYSEGPYPFDGTIIAKDLTYLKGVTFALENNREKIITTLAKALNELGYNLPIHSFTSWAEKNTTTTDDFLNQVYNDTFVFRNYAKNGNEVDTTISVYEVVETICNSYNLFLRQCNNAWNVFQLSALTNPASVKRFVYNASGTQTGSGNVDLREDADRVDVFVMPTSTNKFNPGVKSVHYAYNHRSGTTEIFGDATEIDDASDPALPVAKFTTDFTSSGDEFISFIGTAWAKRSNLTFQGEKNMEASFVIKSNLAYWYHKNQTWETLANLPKATISYTGFISSTNTIEIQSSNLPENGIKYGDVVYISGTLHGLDPAVEYYISSHYYDGAKILIQLSTTYGGNAANINTPSSGTFELYRINNRLPMSKVSNNSDLYWEQIIQSNTIEVPSDASEALHVYLLAGVEEFFEDDGNDSFHGTREAADSNWKGITAKIQDPTTSSADSFSYQLLQTGNFSQKTEIKPSFFGDGPTDYAKAALRYSTSLANITDGWQFRHLISNTWEAFEKIKLQEALHVQRKARRNGAFQIWGLFKAHQILTHDSTNFFFLGGTFTPNEFEGDFFEINFDTTNANSDVLSEFVKSDGSNSLGSSAGSGSVAGNSSTVGNDNRYLLKANNLSGLQSATTARTNLGLGTTDNVTFNQGTFNGTLTINADIYQNGDAYETHAEQFYTKKDLIISRDGATTGLTSGAISGLKVLLANGTNNVIVGVDNQAIARLGWENGTLQAIATRQDTPTNEGIAFWDASTTKFTTSSNATLDSSGNVRLASAYVTPILYSANQSAYALKIGASNNSSFDMGVQIKSTSGGVPYMSLRTASQDDLLTLKIDKVGVNTSNPAYNLDVNGTFRAVGDVHVGADILPTTNYESNIGSFNKKFLTLHAAELNVETIVASERRSTIGGRLNIGLGNILSNDLSTSGTTLYVKHNNLNVNDILHLEKDGSVEFMKVTASNGGSEGNYSYSVSRNLDGSGANAWIAGDSLINTGTTGNAFLDIYSLNSLKTGISTNGATIAYMERTGTTYNDIDSRAVVGNLKGWYGYTNNVYGAGFGDYSNENLVIDPTNGLRIRSGSNVALEANSGTLKVGDNFVYTASNSTLKISGWTFDHEKITSTGVTIKSGSSAHIALGSATSLTAGTGVWQDGLGKWRVGNPSGNYVKWDGTDLDIKSNSFDFDSTNLNINSTGTSYPDAVYDSNKDSVTSSDLGFSVVDNSTGNSGVVTFGEVAVNYSDIEEIIKIHVKYDINFNDSDMELGVWVQGQKVSDDAWEDLPIPQSYDATSANFVYIHDDPSDFNILDKTTAGTLVDLDRYTDRLGVKLNPSSSTSLDGSYTFYIKKSLRTDYDHYRVQAQVLNAVNINLSTSNIESGSYVRPYSTVIELNSRGLWMRKADAIYLHNNSSFEIYTLIT